MTADYFSTAWQEAAELRPAMLVRRQRDSVRPIPLRFTQPKLGNLVPTEHWLGRAIGWLLGGGIALGGAACILLFGLLDPQPISFASPTLQKLFIHAERLLIHATAHWNRSPVRSALSLANLTMANIGFCILLIASSAVLYNIARRMSGVFGGLVVLLLLVTRVAMQHQLNLAEPVALAGIGCLFGGWRSDGIGRSLLGSLLLGLAATVAHSQVLLLPLLLVIALDLPWRWSWLIPLAWLAPIALLGWSDARLFGVIPNLGNLNLTATVSAHQELAGLFTLLHNRNDPAWILAPLAVAGIGLVARVDWRWSILLSAMLLPAAGQFLLHGPSSPGLSLLLLSPLLLASTWTTFRSAWATGLVTAVVSGLSLWISLGNG